MTQPDFDWKTAETELSQKLDPKHVRPPAQGKFGEYIEGWHAIAEANRIFGFGGWSYRIDSLQETANEELELPVSKDTFKRQRRVSYLATVTVIVGNVTRQDIGMGSGQCSPTDVVAAIEGAAKEAVTDALKRALRTFGNPFGLALYDKSKANVGVEPQTITEAQYLELTGALDKLGDGAASVEKRILHRYRIQGLPKLPANQFELVKKGVEKELQKQEKTDAA